MYEKGLPKKDATPQVMAIQGGRIQKANKKSLNAKGKGKGKGKGKDESYIPKPKTLNLLLKSTRLRMTPATTTKRWGIVSKNNVLYFNTISSDGIYEINMHNLVPNVFKNKVGNQIEKTIKALRSDRGGEYISQEFKDYLKACVQQLTPPYTPQHNGVSERRNQTATRILNMVPTKKVEKTPYELWIPKGNDRLLFLLPPENKIIVARYAEFLEKNILSQEVSGMAEELAEIQDKDISPSENTSKIRMEVEGFKPPQEEVVLVRRSARTHQAINRLCLNVEVEEHNLRFKIDNSKRGNISMQERLDLNKTQGASTPEEVKRMRNIPYASAVVSIMYVVRCTRPDVAFAQNITSNFQQNLGKPHWTAKKTIVKYLKNIKDKILVYGGNPEGELRVNCCCNAGFETNRDDIKSQIGYVSVLNRGIIDWKSSKQSTTAIMCLPNSHDIHKMNIRLPQLTRLSLYGSSSLSESSDSLEENDRCEDLQLQATANFKADHVDAYDSDCDDEVATNTIFMENLSPVGSINDDTVKPRYDSDILYEVPHYDTYHESDMLNSNVQEMEYIENIVFNNESYDELTSNINVISYAEYMVTIVNDADNYVPPPIENNDMILSVIEQMKSQVENVTW
nr:hypothetical protein [Tanacetum cinerariifolium]